MRIARVLTRLNLGGPARQVLASDPLLCERGHEIRVLVGRPGEGEGDLFDEARERGVDVRRVPGLARGPHPWRDLRARRALGEELSRFGPDLVHTHASKAGALGRAAAWRRARVPLVHTFHGHVLEGYFPKLIASRLVAHERRWARRTARVIAVSSATADDLVRLGVCERSKLRIVPPGIDLSRLLDLPAPGAERTSAARALRERIGADESAVVIGAVGRLAAVKRPELAVEAFASLGSEQLLRAHLVFVGDGECRAAVEARRSALPSEVRARIHLLGAVDDVVPIHGALDVVLCTSSNEGLPVALIEASAAARAVISLAVGGVGELIADGERGCLLPSTASAQDIAAELSRLIDDAELRARLGCAARAHARLRHSAEALADGLEAVYGEALEGQREARR